MLMHTLKNSYIDIIFNYNIILKQIIFEFNSGNANIDRYNLECQKIKIYFILYLQLYLPRLLK